MRQRDVVIENIVALENRQLARRVVSYLRETHDKYIERLQWFRTMVSGGMVGFLVQEYFGIGVHGVVV
ncbi:hypothetical protein Tco_0552197, partial [Tanacetum coccineum]